MGIDVAPYPPKNELMYRYIFILFMSFSFVNVNAQIRKDCLRHRDSLKATAAPIEKAAANDSFPRPIPFMLQDDLFVPKKYLFGYLPWTYAPFPKPTVFVLPEYGFNGSVGFGLYSIQHPDRFFSTLEGFTSALYF